MQVGRNKGKILKTPIPMLWHCFSSTVIVPRNRSTPPSLLATSAAVQNPKATASAEWGEQLGHHRSYTFPFKEALIFLWKLKARKLIHPSALPAGSCKQVFCYWPQHTQDKTQGGCRSYTRHGSAVGNSGCKVCKLPHRGSPTTQACHTVLACFVGLFLAGCSITQASTVTVIC